MHLDADAADGLIKGLVVDHGLHTVHRVSDLEAEGVWGAFAGSDQEVVRLARGRQVAVGGCRNPTWR
jgi:hypothetical protein